MFNGWMWVLDRHSDSNAFLAYVRIVVVRSLSCVQLFATPWTSRQASLSFTSPQSLLRFMSTESVMPSNHLISSFVTHFCPQSFPIIRVFSNELALPIRYKMKTLWKSSLYCIRESFQNFGLLHLLYCVTIFCNVTQKCIQCYCV